MVRACIVLLLLHSIASIGRAQKVDTSFTLLWYKGKKINDSSILIPTGQTVTFQRSQMKLRVNTPKGQDILQTVQKQLKQGEQRKSALAQLIIRSDKGPKSAGFVYHMSKAMNIVHRRFQPLSKNELEFDVPQTPDQGVHPTTATGLPLEIDLLFEEVVAYAQKIRGAAIPQPPAPPSMGLDYCYPCDKGRVEAYANGGESFEQWHKEERDMTGKAMKVLSYISNRVVASTARDSTRKQGLYDEIWDAVEVIQERLAKKFLLAWNTYNTDAEKIPYLTEAIFSFLRSQQLVGLKTIPNFPSVLEISSVGVERAMQKLETAKKENDYKVTLNISWITAIFRAAELLGMDDEKFNVALSDFMTYNRFKVKIDGHAKMSNEGTVMAARMSAQNIFAVAPDSNCVLKWALISPHEDKMEFNLEGAVMKTPEAEATYVGTKKWKSLPANLQLDFCDETKDTFFLNGLLPDGGQEMWMVEGQKTPAGIVHSLFSQCFLDVKRLKALASDGALQAKLQKQMNEKYQEFMKNYQGKDPSTMTPAEIQKMNEAMIAARDMGSVIQSASVYSFICKDRLINKQKIIFDSEVDGKKLNPQNTHVDEAILEVKIEHVENE